MPQNPSALTKMRRYGATDRRRSGSESRDDKKKKLSPFPWNQLIVLACCRICEPIAFMSIFPYIYYMIEDFHITDDANKISIYAGMVTSSFTLAEFAAGVFWGRLSDKIGRKPVLLCGLIGTAISVILFGFAPSLPVALFARALGGLLNGNIGVLQTTVAELVTVKEHQPRAYTIMPSVWCVGSIIGPMIGGALARPCINYPDRFHPGTIWDKYPYLLPNVCSAVAVLLGVIIGILFLEETHAIKKNERDIGREVGDYLLSMLPRFRASNKLENGPEKKCLLDTEDSSDSESLPEYRSQENSPRLAPQPDTEIPPLREVQGPGSPGFKTFTRPVIMIIASYGILAFHTITYDQLFPVFLSTAPPEHPSFESPLKFLDGFGLETKTIGMIMSVQGFYSLFSNYFIVTPVTKRFGSLRLFQMLALSYFVLYFVTPYVVLLPDTIRMPAVYLLVIWKCTFSTLAYPSNAIMLTNSTPSKQVLGTINGVAASTASLCRALGPTLSGLLNSVGLRTGYSGLAWWFTAIIAIVGGFLSLQITEDGGNQGMESRTHDENSV